MGSGLGEVEEVEEVDEEEVKEERTRGDLSWRRVNMATAP